MKMEDREFVVLDRDIAQELEALLRVIETACGSEKDLERLRADGLAEAVATYASDIDDAILEALGCDD